MYIMNIESIKYKFKCSTASLCTHLIENTDDSVHFIQRCSEYLDKY